MTETQSASGETWTYANNYYGTPDVLRDFEMLAKFRPEVFDGYIALRQAAFNTDEGAALSAKEKELIILAIEIARTKTNPPPVGHAKKFIDAGGTPEELAEVAGLCIMIGGMLTYQEAGRYALRTAMEYYEEKHGA